MNSQHWPGDPERKAPPDSGPQDAPHLHLGMRARRLKKEEAEREAALNQFRQTPEQRLQDVFARLARVEEWMRTLHGQPPIRVTGSVIEFMTPPQQRADAVGETGALEVQEEGSQVVEAATFLNFKGDIVEAAANGDGANITILGVVEPVRIVVGGVAEDVDFIIVPPP